MAMTKPSNFILHSSYATLKNDGNATAQLVIPNGFAIPSNGFPEISTIVTVGSLGGSLRIRMKTQANTTWRPGSSVELVTNINYPGDGTYPQSTSINVERINATQVKVYCILENYSPSTAYVSGTYTIDVKINTFLSPFVT